MFPLLIFPIVQNKESVRYGEKREVKCIYIRDIEKRNEKNSSTGVATLRVLEPQHEAK